MKIQAKTLWKVPVYCAVASWISSYATVYLGRFFFVVQEMGADGVIQVSADPIRSAIFNGVLFLIVLFVGGLWAFRNMTKKEIAVSAAIMTAYSLGLHTIALTGRDGGKLARLAEISLIMPQQETYRIQEEHLAIYHLLCAAVEYELFEA